MSSAEDHGLEFQDQSPTYQSDRWKLPEKDNLNDSGVLLAEESPVKVDDHAPDPDAFDSGVGIVLDDRAPGYDPADEPEPPPAPKAKRPTPQPQALPAPPTQAPTALPERRTAVAPQVDLTRPGVAVCPECEAKNAYQARLCARCGAEIPLPTDAPLEHAKHNGILKGGFTAKNRGPVDADLIPDHVKEEWRQKGVEIQERMDLRQEHRKKVVKEIAIAGAVGFVIASVLLGAALPGWLRGAFIFLDGGIGVAAAYIVFYKGYNRLQSAGVYGGLAFLTHTFKVLLLVAAAMAAGNPIMGAGSFIFWVSILGLTTLFGFGIGMQLEMQRWDQEI